MKGHAIVSMVLMFTSVAMTSFGQQSPASMQTNSQYNDELGIEHTGGPGRGEPMSEEKRAEIRKKIEAIRIWRLTEELKLDANTSAKLSSLLSSLEQKRREIQREQMATLNMLQQSLKAPKIEESRIKSDLDKLEKDYRAMQDLKYKEMSGLKNILTIEQQGRYVIFQLEFMREMRGMIRGARGTGR
jgi:Spy/CpxP family protein refolding chaperone